MSHELIGIIGIASLFTVLALGVPIGFAMGIIGTAGFAVLVSWDAALVKIATSSSITASVHTGMLASIIFCRNSARAARALGN